MRIPTTEKKPREKYLLRELPQVGTSKSAVDALIKAKLPGKRESAAGNVYWETRVNRSDKRGKRI